MIFDHDVPVAMTDGVKLRVNIYRPEKPGRYPVLMLMGPYGKDTIRWLRYSRKGLPRYCPGKARSISIGKSPATVAS
ncbi:CocE/NonD family hydrolase [Paraburkholderia heleia]|uniref:CocE/NonD family hydrolase n=1 Tax=Paraburkholderia heleia TaxID=634127 RepID=UPI0005AA47A9